MKVFDSLISLKQGVIPRISNENLEYELISLQVSTTFVFVTDVISCESITSNTAQKQKFSFKDIFSKCDQIRNFLL